MSGVKEAVVSYILDSFGVEPDYPFPTAPGYPVFRHPNNRKWFALIMDVPRRRLGLGGEERVDILNLKTAVAMAGALRSRPGILPAYHMNRDNWISVLLDGTVPSKEIFPLIDLSHTLTRARTRKAPPPAGESGQSVDNT